MANNYDKLTGREWSELLNEHPECADKCDWDKLDGGDGHTYLRAVPSLQTNGTGVNLANKELVLDWGQMKHIGGVFFVDARSSLTSVIGIAYMAKIGCNCCDVNRNLPKDVTGENWMGGIGASCFNLTLSLPLSATGIN